MKISKVPDDNGKGFTRIIRNDDFEFVNPIEYYKKNRIASMMTMDRDILIMNNPPFPISHCDEYLYERANKKYEDWYKSIRETEVPPNFIKLLTAESKNEQEKLLKRQTLTVQQLMAFIFLSYEDFGFTLSEYTGENHRKGIDEIDLPTLIRVTEDGVDKAGETPMTDGQLKNVVESRKVIVSKILDKNGVWHCFFLTFNSIAGKESWKGGQAHFHYISDKFGITREEAVKQLKSKKYPATSVHIALKGYGNQGIE